MMTSQILQFLDLPKIQKLKYPENEILFFASNKKFLLLHIKDYNSKKERR